MRWLRQQESLNRRIRLVVERVVFGQRVQRVQCRIAQKVEQVAVQAVGAAFGDRVYLPAGRLPEFYGVVRSLRLELLDRVH